MHNEAYYEKHKYVAVMFATVIHADSEDTDLRLMNEIVCDFDDVVGGRVSNNTITKRLES